MNAILRKAYRDLTRRRLRSLLTLGGIVIGVAGIVAIVSTSRNLVTLQRRAYAAAHQADATFWTWNAPAAFVRAVEGLPNVAAAELRADFFTKWQVRGRWRDVHLIGVADFAQARIDRMTLATGRFPGPDELLVEVSALEIEPLTIGQPVLVRDRQGKDRVLRVSGFSRSPTLLSAALTNVPVAYAPARTVRRMMDATGYNQLLVRFQDFEAREETLRAIERLFDRRGLPRSAPRVRDPDSFPGKRELDALIGVMFLFSGLGLLLSGFLVANTLSAIVAEQVGEIGVLKALGGTRRQVLATYLVAAGLYGVGGTAVGLVLGTAVGAQLLARIARLGGLEASFQISPPALALGTVVGLGVTLLGGLPPTWIGTAISVREALGSYGITAQYGRGRVERTLARWQGLPPLARMALRNLLRRVGRTGITLGVVSLATAGLLAAVSTRASVDGAIAQVFTTYNADAWIWFSQPMNLRFAAALEADPAVTAAEPWVLSDAWVAHRRVRLWGLPADTRLYQPHLAAGRWYRPGEHDAVVVSAELAGERGIAVGERVEVDVGERTRAFRVVGIAIDNSIILGSQVAGKVFMTPLAANTLRERGDAADLFAIKTVSPAPEVVAETLARLERRFRRLRPVTEAAYEDLQAAQRPARLLSLALWGMVVLIAGIGVIGVVNTLTLSVTERRREIGVLRAIGATNAHLTETFLIEGLALGALGWLIALGMGWATGRAFVAVLSRALFPMAFVFPPTLVLVSLGFALGLATVGSLGPALGAARLPAQEALRYE